MEVGYCYVVSQGQYEDNEILGICADEESAENLKASFLVKFYSDEIYITKEPLFSNFGKLNAYLVTIDRGRPSNNKVEHLASPPSYFPEIGNSPGFNNKDDDYFYVFGYFDTAEKALEHSIKLYHENKRKYRRF